MTAGSSPRRWARGSNTSTACPAAAAGAWKGVRLSTVDHRPNHHSPIPASPPPFFARMLGCHSSPEADVWKAQAGQDRFLFRAFFRDPEHCRNGTFVEFGARNGIEHSNTYAFERALGWRGLLFEADEREYASLRANRPGSFAFQGAVCPPRVTQIPMFLSRNGGWSGPAATYPTRRRASTRRRATVRCHDLSGLLKALRIDSVDLMTIDTEGSELSIVSSFPWHEHNVRVVQIESLDESAYPSQRGNRQRIGEHMNRSGYDLFATHTVSPDDTYDLIFSKRGRREEASTRRP